MRSGRLRCGRRRGAVPTAEANAGLSRRRQEGTGHRWFPSPLDTPDPPLRRDSLRSRGEMRGRGVCCSKGTPLIEAELFAAQSKRPAPSGCALLCVADCARQIQGIEVLHNHPDARKRAPVSPPFRRATAGSRVLRKVWGVKRGKKTLVVFPLLPPPPGGGTPPRHVMANTPDPGRAATRLRRQAAGTAEPFTPCSREGV